MGSQFNFGVIAEQIPAAFYAASAEMAIYTKDYFVRSFNTQSWRGVKWENVKRPVPPDILVDTGDLKSEVEDPIKEVSMNGFAMAIDPTDERGQGYAAYHNEGKGRNKLRVFASHTPELQAGHIAILKKHIGGAWQRAN